MDHFLFAYNPLKPAAKTGLQGYILDTVKNTVIELSIIHIETSLDDAEENEIALVNIYNPVHKLQLIKGTGNIEADAKSCIRAARWYDAWLQQQGVNAKVDVNWMAPNPSPNFPKGGITPNEGAELEIPDRLKRNATNDSRPDPQEL